MLKHVLEHIRQNAPSGTTILHGQQTPELEQVAEPPHGTVYYVEYSGMMYGYDARVREWFEMGAWHDMAAYGLLLTPLKRRSLRSPSQRRIIRMDAQ